MGGEEGLLQAHFGGNWVWVWFPGHDQRARTLDLPEVSPALVCNGPADPVLDQRVDAAPQGSLSSADVEHVRVLDPASPEH